MDTAIRPVTFAGFFLLGVLGFGSPALAEWDFHGSPTKGKSEPADVQHDYSGGGHVDTYRYPDGSVQTFIYRYPYDDGRSVGRWDGHRGRPSRDYGPGALGEWRQRKWAQRESNPPWHANPRFYRPGR
jgi:hypothetical protein